MKKNFNLFVTLLFLFSFNAQAFLTGGTGGGGGGAVDSVNGQTGVVVLTPVDIGAQDTITGAATTVTSSDLTASKAVVSNASGKILSSATSSTEIGYVAGVTSAIQTQLDAKQATITGAATSIASSNLTASRATVSDGSGKVAAATTTSTEIGYVNGVTSAIQTQLNAKGALTKTTLYTSSDTWHKASGAKWVCIYLVGGGGQAGSGAVGANGNGSAKCGGGSGAAGMFVQGCFDAAILDADVTVTIGAGGTSSNGQTADSTNGQDGVIGGDTSFGNFLKAPGGGRGRGGTIGATCTGTAGTATASTSSPWNFAQFAGVSASTTGLVGASPSNSQFLSPNSGASGGGLTTADAISNGAVGGAIGSIFSTNQTAAGGAAGAAAPANAGDGNSVALFTGFYMGSGGGSSRSSTSQNSGNGGAGALFGGGGGGSGAANNTHDSGNGGAGANGGMLVVEFF